MCDAIATDDVVQNDVLLAGPDFELGNIAAVEEVDHVEVCILRFRINYRLFHYSYCLRI